MPGSYQNILQKSLPIVLLFLGNCLYCQYNETIISGRPGQAIGPRTLGLRVFQVQSGLNYNPVTIESAKQRTFSSATVLRLGILERLEINALIQWQADNFSETSALSNINGFSNTQIGARYNFIKNKGIIPTLGIQGRLLLKAQGKYYQREKTGTKWVLATTNKINNRLSLTSNWIVEWDGNNIGADYGYVMNLSANLTETLSIFIETYGSLDTFQIHLDTGLALLLNKNLQIDSSFGWQGSSGHKNWFLDAGVSWRFDWR